MLAKNVQYQLLEPALELEHGCRTSLVLLFSSKEIQHYR